MTDQLKPCPFCGHKTKLIIPDDTRHIPEGYALVLIDDLRLMAETTSAINTAAGEYIKAMIKAGDYDD